ncbi:MAG: hypothetical protein AVDCRST_MAG87-3004 [uncultured Thermomicrobiales bacterium]|uniref:Uncharacterized protein n=1 Tax=uncultured Thermomicrobiales bacterium TaxID=1645740 RepID=A0A6J4VM67_9BACT|nr:MAG: hypothetical protein AVDCRST_MAG87-3004 [uncultured Thermomicrobiales bacterium]
MAMPSPRGKVPPDTTPGRIALAPGAGQRGPRERRVTPTPGKPPLCDQ